MKYSTLEPLNILSSDITWTIFIGILFVCSWYRFFFPFSQSWNDFSDTRDDLENNLVEIYVRNLQSHSLNPRINLLNSVQMKVILKVFPCVLLILQPGKTSMLYLHFLRALNLVL